METAITHPIDTSVLIVGAGPVGLTLAMDLAWRGLDVTVVELRSAGEPPHVKCNQVSARSMEIFRRLGLAGKVRDAGLPADFPNDVIACTSVTGIELSRVGLPCRAKRFADKQSADSWWPTAEPSHRINQIYLEPVLFAHAASQPRIRIINRVEFESFVQHEDCIIAKIRDTDSASRFSISARYLVGCDGGKSSIRKAIGARLSGTPVIQRVQSTCIHAPRLIELLPGKRGWMYISLNPRRGGMTIAIDGREKWLVHNFLQPDEQDVESIDRDWAIREILGVGSDFHYDVVSKEDWTGRRLVADRFRDRRAFICGDAAHLWMPHAGYGMNAGIADAANLSWMLAATLRGWARPAILDAYEAERQPITEQVSRFATDVAVKNTTQRREVPAEVEWPGPVGDAMRARIGQEAYELYRQQQCAAGLNFGYFYENSPIIAYDGEPHPAYTMSDFTTSSVPGCRTPHLWLDGNRSLYDALGPDFTLIRTDPKVSAAGVVDAAVRCAMPLTVLDVDTADAQPIYAHKLVLVRPDQHVAWRGDEEPTAPGDLIDLVRGAFDASARSW